MQQLDLFADSVPVQRANALIGALARFDRDASGQAFQALLSVDPGNAGRSRFEILSEFVANWPDGPADPGWPHTLSAVAAAEQLILERIVPATAIMGDAGKMLLRRCWFDLAASSEAAGIGPESLECFAAELYLRAQAWPDVVRSCQGIPGAAMRAAVQRWLGLGYCRSGERDAGRGAALRYAWLAPQRFSAFVAELNDAALTGDWVDFQADLGDLDATWFPAWCVHERRAMTVLDNLPQGDGPMAYHLVVGLAIRERGGLCAAVYDDRARLKGLGESFFAFYMGRRSDAHSRLRLTPTPASHRFP